MKRFRGRQLLNAKVTLVFEKIYMREGKKAIRNNAACAQFKNVHILMAVPPVSQDLRQHDFLDCSHRKATQPTTTTLFRYDKEE